MSGMSDKYQLWGLGKNFHIFLGERPFVSCFSHLTDKTSYQSAALPPLAAPAQTWKSRTANMN